MTGPIAVILAKAPMPGRVKTRLSGVYGPDVAAELALAMLQCTVDRLVRRGPVLLATTPDDAGPELARQLGHPDLPTTPQGEGDLGDRLARVWREVVGEHPLAFFGMDCPDAPDGHLDAIATALAAGRAAIGPTEDGGYWTLAAPGPLRELLVQIDWGSDRVYDQTLRRADRASIPIERLPTWPDVDVPDDVRRLHDRLRNGCLDAGWSTDDPRFRLLDRLDRLVGR